MSSYSPSAAKIYSFCSKKYYFNWLSKRKHGWVKEHTHPWYRVYSLKRVKNSDTWAGDIYHQVMGYTLDKLRRKRVVTLEEVKKLAHELIDAQFTYSREKRFLTEPTSHAPKLENLSVFLSLFQHMYDLPDTNILEETNAKLDLWLANTFSWSQWSKLIEAIKQAKFVYVEPNNLRYEIADTQITARMDLGIEYKNNSFLIVDWKCYRDEEDFQEYNEKSFRHQLLTYAIWPRLRSPDPIPLSDVRTKVFYPTTGETIEFKFSEVDLFEFEQNVRRWITFHDQIFTDVREVEFEDLSGPANPSRVCPYCNFKGICGDEIEWHKVE